MNNLGIFLNYHLLTPAVSYLSPAKAYKLCSITGAIGKSIKKGSYRYNGDILRSGLDTICNLLKVDQKTGIDIIEKFFHIETRVQLEHIWLAKEKIKLLPEMVDIKTLRLMADEVKKNGPSLIITAHTAYYFLLPWALHYLGLKVAYVMANPRLCNDNSLLKGITAIDAMEKIMPVIYTDTRNTVNRCVDFINKGYSVIIVIDIPATGNNGVSVRLMGRDAILRTGYASICKMVKPPVYAVFSYLKNLTAPYGIIYRKIIDDAPGHIAQEWARLLEQIVKESPESWLGWFYLWKF